MFNEINICSELKHKSSEEQNLLDEAHLLIDEANSLTSRFNSEIAPISETLLNLNKLQKLDREQVYSTREIKQFCIKYHMRFLYLKNTGFEIEKAVILKIYAFEEKYNIRFKEFYLIISEDVAGQASAKPSILVFGKLAINSFVYFGTYGTPLTQVRKIKYFPLRSIYAFAVYNFIPSFLIAFLMPYDWLQTTVEAEWSLRLWFTFHIYIALFGFSMFIGASGNMRFSDNEWDVPFNKLKR